jgi:hypothetical protein
LEVKREEIEKLIERLHQALEQQRISKAFENREIMDGKLAEDVLFMIRDSAFALRHLLQAQTWRPISEANTDGTLFMITGGTYYYDLETYPTPHECDFPVVGYFDEVSGEWLRDGYGREFDGKYIHRPTHWMPLPQPPSSFEERESATPSDQQNEGDA